MGMPKGQSGNPKGKPPGTLNTISRTAKENIADVFDHVGGILEMVKWAKENQTEFYRIYAKLLPVDINAKVEKKILKIEVDISDRTQGKHLEDYAASKTGDGTYIVSH
jgi:hypothetical protein